MCIFDKQNRMQTDLSLLHERKKVLRCQKYYHCCRSSVRRIDQEGSSLSILILPDFRCSQNRLDRHTGQPYDFFSRCFFSSPPLHFPSSFFASSSFFLIRLIIAVVVVVVAIALRSQKKTQSTHTHKLNLSCISWFDILIYTNTRISCIGDVKSAHTRVHTHTQTRLQQSFSIHISIKH